MPKNYTSQFQYSATFNQGGYMKKINFFILSLIATSLNLYGANGESLSLRFQNTTRSPITFDVFGRIKYIEEPNIPLATDIKLDPDQSGIMQIPDISQLTMVEAPVGILIELKTPIEKNASKDFSVMRWEAAGEPRGQERLIKWSKPQPEIPELRQDILFSEKGRSIDIQFQPRVERPGKRPIEEVTKPIIIEPKVPRLMEKIKETEEMEVE